MVAPSSSTYFFDIIRVIPEPCEPAQRRLQMAGMKIDAQIRLSSRTPTNPTLAGIDCTGTTCGVPALPRWAEL
jgi:hypothetical protein